MPTQVGCCTQVGYCVQVGVLCSSGDVGVMFEWGCWCCVRVVVVLYLSGE